VILDITRHFLERDPDLSVTTATNAPDALSLLATISFDAVVSDFEMPDMNGIAFLHEVRAKGLDVPFIIFTGRGREEVAIQALNEGADFYLQKGGDPASQFAELAHKIRNAVEGRRNRRFLAESEAKFRTLAESTSVAILMFQDTGWIYANPAAEALTGFTREEILSMPYGEIIHPDSRELIRMRGAARLRGEEQPRRYIIDILRKDGTVRIVDFTADIIVLGEKPAVIVSAVDITERTKAEDALRESEELNRGLIEQLPDYVFIYDEDYRICYANPEAERALGMKAADLIGRPMQSVFAGERRGLPDVPVSGTGDLPAEVDIFTASGSIITTIVKTAPVHFSNRRATLAVLTDITWRKKLENDLERNTAELEQYYSAITQANRKLNLLSSITRHDILNQLTVLLGFLKVAEDSTRSRTAREMLAGAGEAARTIHRQIEFTRSYQDLGVRSPCWQNLQEIIASCKTDRIEFHRNLPPVEVYADPLLEKVFANLLDNTLRHGAGATTVTVSISGGPGDDMLVCWEDDGQGVEPSEKARIFVNGFGKHTGYGLFLVREILSITGIAIEETGEYGSGARFEIRVPSGAWRSPSA
jgi:PAS domain S-box-containing protein